MPDTMLRVEVTAGTSVSAVRTAARGGAPPWTLVYAPGAGANIDDPFGRCLADVLPARGVSVVRFQFPYMEAHRRTPDRTPVLEATWRAVIDAVRTPGEKLCVGGRSMGGRIASQVVAGRVVVDALALFAYPLHPPGLPERSRDAHLASVRVRTLFCSGTRDAFASPDELRVVAARMRRAKVHLLEKADHSFAPPRASARTRDDVFAEAAAALARWLRV